MKYLPQGERILPVLAAALFFLLFIAGPLADIGVLKRPLIGIVMLVVVLAGLFTLGTLRRFALPLVVLGAIAFVCQTATLLWPSEMLNLTDDIAGVSLVLMLCALLLARDMAPGRVTTN
jgi:hypothetical protein